MAALKISLLASFQVTLDGQAINDFPTDKARALLAYLVVEHQHPHRREALAALIWPDQPDERARQSLRQALSSLRQTLHDTSNKSVPFLLVDRHEVQFNPAADFCLDVAIFADLAAFCQRHRHRAPGNCLPCLRRLEEMVALYAGDFLAGFVLPESAPFEEWAMLKREWLHCQAVEALGELAKYHEGRGDFVAARRFAQRQVQMEPWREEAHRQLMRVLAESGQRSAALAQYKACCRAMLSELGVPPTNETTNLYTAVLENRYQPDGEPPRMVNALPLAATPFMGRQAEQAELANLLADPDTRLVTLVGLGGVGKTRLAMQVATDHLGLFPNGVHWLDLAALPTAVLVTPAVAHRVGLIFSGKEAPEDQLLAYLRAKKLLLVLDNAEHLPELAELVANWLQAAPGLTLLVTSRERLALREERVYELEGLAYEAENGASEAVELFVSIARQVQRKFVPTPDDLSAIGAISRQVEGLPLALELAAAWTPDQSCGEIACALAHNADLLTTIWRNVPERQRSMQATFAHSWRLLSAQEQVSFAYLSFFQGGFTPAAALAVAEVNGAVLARLAAKSLLRRTGDGRYHLHGLIRQFAAQKLNDFAEEEARIASGHAAYYLSFLTDQEHALKSSTQDAALAAIDQEIGNIRLAWEWAVDQMAAGHLAAAELLRRGLESLYLFYALHSWYQAGAVLFARAATAVHPAIPNHQLLRGELLARQARCLEFTAPAEEAVALYQQSLTCFQAIGAHKECALPLYGLGYMAHIQGDYDQSRQYFAASLAHYRAVNDLWGEANVLSSLCLTQRRQGAFAEARLSGEESLAIRRVLGDRRGIASSQNNLALVYCALGDYVAAEAAGRESVDICRELGHTVGVANAFTGLVHVAFHERNWARAAHYQQKALALFQEVGDLWGVAIACNNLGQIVLAQGQLLQAQLHFQEGIALYRQLGIKTGLAHTLSNLGQVRAQLGDTTAAAQSLVEALSLAEELGDRPILLEGLARAAVLWAQECPGVRPLVVLAFSRQQPEMLQETREEVDPQYAALQAQFAPHETAVAEQVAASLTLTAVVSETLDILRQFATR